MPGFTQDIRYALRAWAKHPAFTTVALLTLTLGIGATIAMFTVLRSVLWRPLPYPAPERLVAVEADVQGIRNAGASNRELDELRARSRTLAELAVAVGVDAHVEIDGEVERVAAASVTGNLLQTLGVRPILGRLLDDRDEAVQGPARVVVVSHALWSQRLGADPAAIGRQILVNNGAREVIGVLPADFHVFLPASTGVQETAHVWFATGFDRGSDSRGARVIGRLAEHATIADAQRELDLLAAQFAAERPTFYQGGAPVFRVTGVREALTETVDVSLRALGLAVAFVLLVCCINVANLSLARMAGRSREIAVRTALGAGRARLAQQLVTESVLLSAAGGAIGVLVGRWGIQLLVWAQPVHLPRQGQLGMDWTVVIFSLAVTLTAGVLLGILPALRITAAETEALREGRAYSSGRASRTLQRALVVSEVAVACILLVGAGLMLRSFVNLMSAPLGFNPDRVVTAWMPVNFRQFPDVSARISVHKNVLEHIRALPGVEAASAGTPLPFHQLQFTGLYGRSGEGAPTASATQQSVLPGYIDVMGTRLLEGRDFTTDDIAHRRLVVIVDARIARQLWPSGAIGQRLAFASGRRVADLEVIGVTEPIRVTAVRDDHMPHLLVPYHLNSSDLALVIKTSVPPAALQPALRKIAQDAGTGRAVFDVWPLGDYVSRSTADTRFTMTVLGGFAAAAVLLAMIGLYGTLSHLSAQRSREFGVRVALGATRWRIMVIVAREGFALTTAGAVAGILAALGVTGILRGLLYGVEPVDPATLSGVVAAIGALAMAASLKPAWSAGKTDPLIALRFE